MSDARAATAPRAVVLPAPERRTQGGSADGTGSYYRSRANERGAA
ncbi:hypothetical protein [Streptomyces sp. HNM1019]